MGEAVLYAVGKGHQPGHQARGSIPPLVQQAMERHQVCYDQPR